MPALTRRRNRDALQETWLIYFGDVRVGAVSRSVGNPNAAPQWQWHCGFYPGSAPGECKSGTAASFRGGARGFRGRMARVSVEPHEADFQAWRDQRD
jgi:hypothetical protein